LPPASPLGAPPIPNPCRRRGLHCSMCANVSLGAIVGCLTRQTLQNSLRTSVSGASLCASLSIYPSLHLSLSLFLLNDFSACSVHCLNTCRRGVHAGVCSREVASVDGDHKSDGGSRSGSDSDSDSDSDGGNGAEAKQDVGAGDGEGGGGPTLTTAAVASHVGRLAQEAAVLSPLSAFEAGPTPGGTSLTDPKEDFMATQSVVHAFARHCREHGFAAEPFFLRKKKTATLNLRNYSLGSDRAGALALALRSLPFLMVWSQIVGAGCAVVCA
jgi:hypothetical protein